MPAAPLVGKAQRLNMANILISGIVAVRNGRPYLQIAIDGKMCQCSMTEARSVARDIERMCARTEADAMIHKFFKVQEFPDAAAGALMIAFRDFRSELDAESVEQTEDY